jgi:hypothetical protein
MHPVGPIISSLLAAMRRPYVEADGHGTALLVGDAEGTGLGLLMAPVVVWLHPTITTSATERALARMLFSTLIEGFGYVVRLRPSLS